VSRRRPRDGAGDRAAGERALRWLQRLLQEGEWVELKGGECGPLPARALAGEAAHAPKAAARNGAAEGGAPPG
jgi:hypothetical protein